MGISRAVHRRTRRGSLCWSWNCPPPLRRMPEKTGRLSCSCRPMWHLSSRPLTGPTKSARFHFHLDFINVMTYDFHGHWEAVTGHNSSLYHSSMDSGSHNNHNIDSSVSYWLSLGAPAEKLLLGFPTYGRTFSLITSANSLGAPANGPADAGAYTHTSGFWAFYEICESIPSATGGWISEQEVPYAIYGSAWVGYDNERSFSSKVQWMTANNLGGAHVWTLDMDDFGRAFCSSGPYPLINHLRKSMSKQ